MAEAFSDDVTVLAFFLHATQGDEPREALRHTSPTGEHWRLLQRGQRIGILLLMLGGREGGQRKPPKETMPLLMNTPLETAIYHLSNSAWHQPARPPANTALGAGLEIAGTAGLLASTG